MKLSQLGWTILRFQDAEIEDQAERVMSTIVKTIMQKEASLKSP
jgi:very-short-patch-repair endonuclease